MGSSIQSRGVSFCGSSSVLASKIVTSQELITMYIPELMALKVSRLNQFTSMSWR